MVKISGQPGWINWKASEFLSLNKSSLVEIYFNTYERLFQSLLDQRVTQVPFLFLFMAKFEFK